MHVLFISKWYPGRNDPQLGVFIQKHALAVAQHAITSVIFAHPVEGQTQDLLIDRSINGGLLELRAYYRKDLSTNPFVRKVKNLLMLRKAYAKALSELEAERGLPDVCHAHILTRSVLPALYLKRKAAIPFVISEQASEFLNGKFDGHSWLHRWFTKRAFNQARAHTAVSSHLSEGMRKVGLNARFRIVPNVLPLADYPLPAKGPATRFMMVADLVDETKNISGVLYAMEVLVKTHGNARLDIIGGGADEAQLKALATELGLDDAVTFLGRMPNSEVLKRMSLTGSVIINSRYETFSVVTGEALMFGKPVIATRCGGPNDMVNAQNGYLIPVDDRGALEQAMLKLIAEHDSFDPATIRATVGERTRSNAVGLAFMEIYKEVLA